MTGWNFYHYSELASLDSYLWWLLAMRNSLMVSIAIVLAFDVFTRETPLNSAKTKSRMFSLKLLQPLMETILLKAIELPKYWDFQDPF